MLCLPPGWLLRLGGGCAGKPFPHSKPAFWLRFSLGFGEFGAHLQTGSSAPLSQGNAPRTALMPSGQELLSTSPPPVTCLSSLTGQNSPDSALGPGASWDLAVPTACVRPAHSRGTQQVLPGLPALGSFRGATAEWLALAGMGAPVWLLWGGEGRAGAMGQAPVGAWGKPPCASSQQGTLNMQKTLPAPQFPPSLFLLGCPWEVGYLLRWCWGPPNS